MGTTPYSVFFPTPNDSLSFASGPKGRGRCSSGSIIYYLKALELELDLDC